MTPACRPMSACGTLNVDAGSVRRLHSSPPTTVAAPPSGANTTHSPAPTSGGGTNADNTNTRIAIIDRIIEPGRQCRGMRAFIAALSGTALEWYDFALYNVAAAIVFGPLFFPSSDPMTSVLAAFSTYAVGYF